MKRYSLVDAVGSQYSIPATSQISSGACFAVETGAGVISGFPNSLDMIITLLNNDAACGCASLWQHVDYPPALSPKSVMWSDSLPRLGTKCWIHFRSVCWSQSPRLLLLVGVDRQFCRWGEQYLPLARDWDARR